VRVTVYLVRHAKAGDRDGWADDDRLRPLSGRGHRQAYLLVDLLADAKFDRILSSPYVRCMQTVVPIAGARGLPVEPVEALAEDAPLDDALELVQKHAISGALMCMHGDLMPMLLDHYASSGVEMRHELRWPKGCTWVLETDATGEVVRARYLPPPVD
jgi:phosphohistidine phosphatase SixA